MKKSADDHIRQFESGYDHLYEEVGIDLYDLLQTIFEGTDEEYDGDLTEDDAPDLCGSSPPDMVVSAKRRLGLPSCTAYAPHGIC